MFIRVDDQMTRYPARTTGMDSCVTSCVHPDTVVEVRRRMLPEPQIGRVSAVFKLLGDPTRASLLYALLETGELCVCDLSAATGVSEATVSQALRLLRTTGVVVGRRQGRLVYYRLADAHVRMLLDLTREHVQHTDDTDDTDDVVRPGRSAAGTKRTS